MASKWPASSATRLGLRQTRPACVRCHPGPAKRISSPPTHRSLTLSRKRNTGKSMGWSLLPQRYARALRLAPDAQHSRPVCQADGKVWWSMVSLFPCAEFHVEGSDGGHRIMPDEQVLGGSSSSAVWRTCLCSL